MLSSLTLSPSVSTQSEAVWEAHTITRRAASLLIRLGEGGVGGGGGGWPGRPPFTSSARPDPRLNQWAPPFAGSGIPPHRRRRRRRRRREEDEDSERAELFVRACFRSISRSLRFSFPMVKYDPRYRCAQP